MSNPSTGRSAAIPINIERVLREISEKYTRPEDDMLHCSQHLWAPLRHVQIDMAIRKGIIPAPSIRERRLDEQIKLLVGTLVHQEMATYLDKPQFKETEAKVEVDVSQGLIGLVNQYGGELEWSGTADRISFNGMYGRVDDYKTTSYTAMAVIAKKNRPKLEHVYQVWAYGSAINQMYSLATPVTLAIHYIGVYGYKTKDSPDTLNFHFHNSADRVVNRMREVEKAVMVYLNDPIEENLAPPPLPTLQQVKDKLYLVRHWTSQYCPHPDLCKCMDAYPGRSEFKGDLDYPTDKDWRSRAIVQFLEERDYPNSLYEQRPEGYWIYDTDYKNTSRSDDTAGQDGVAVPSF